MGGGLWVGLKAVYQHLAYMGGRRVAIPQFTLLANFLMGGLMPYGENIRLRRKWGCCWALPIPQDGHSGRPFRVTSCRMLELCGPR